MAVIEAYHSSCLFSFPPQHDPCSDITIYEKSPLHTQYAKGESPRYHLFSPCTAFQQNTLLQHSGNLNACNAGSA